MKQILEKMPSFKLVFKLYIKLTGFLGILITAWWILAVLPHPDKYAELLIYAGWLLSMSLPIPFSHYRYAVAIIIFFLICLFLLWAIASYDNIRKEYATLETPKETDKKYLFIFIRKCVLKYSKEFCMYTMSLFITVHIYFVLFSLWHSLNN